MRRCTGHWGNGEELGAGKADEGVWERGDEWGRAGREGKHPAEWGADEGAQRAEEPNRSSVVREGLEGWKRGHCEVESDEGRGWDLGWRCGVRAVMECKDENNRGRVTRGRKARRGRISEAGGGEGCAGSSG